MFQLRNMHWWTGALLFSLALLIVVFAYVARRPLCMDSKLVERIDSISSEGTASAFRCGLHRQVPFDSYLAQQMPDLSQRLQRVENFLSWIGPLKSRANLTILRGNSPLFRVQGSEIYMGEPLIQADGQLEKAFLKLWFRQNAHVDLQASALIEESLTDFLYFVLQGQLNLQDFKSGLFLRQELEPRWPRVLSRFSGYCRSLWRTIEDSRLCEDPSLFSDNEIHLMSLRPLISLSLVGAYEQLSFRERLAFFESFVHQLGSLSFQETNFGFSPVEIGKQSYFEAVSQMEKWGFFFASLSSKVSMAEKFSALFQLELKKRGYDRGTQEFLLDTLVFAEDLKPEQSQSLLREIDSQKKLLIGLVSRGSLQMSTKAEALDLRWLGEVRANNGVYLQCGSPDLKKMTELSKRVERLLYVHLCDNQTVNLKGYFERGPETFAKQNPGLKFAEFHLPSLMLALQKMPGQNPIQLLKEKQKDLLLPIGWKDPRYDETAKAYRAQAVIEMVDWFRL